MHRYSTLFLIAFFSLHCTVFAEPTVLKVQKKLKTLGFYCGVVDGLLGSQTNAAIRRYQIKHRLVITGELNEETLYSLKITRAAIRKQYSGIP